MKKIKVLQVIGSLHIGGAENVAMNICRKMDKEKFEMHYLLYTSENNRGEYEEEAEMLGAKIIRIKRNKNFRRVFEEIINRNGPYDIIHSHLMYHNGIIMKIAYKNGVKCRVSHAHSTKGRVNKTIIEKIITYCYQEYMRYCIQKYSNVWLSCGIDAGNYLYGKEFFSKNGVCIQNGIDINKYDFNTEKRNEIRKTFDLEGKFVVGHAAHFIPLKNHSFIIDIFKEILEKKPDSILVLMGDGELKNSIIEKVRKYNIERNVIFTGNISNVNEIMQALDVFILPSLYEGLPVSLIEAQAAGLRCVVSDNITKQVQLNKNVHFMSLSAGVDKWAEKIIEFGKYKRKSEKETIVEKGYCVEKNMKELSSIYISNV